MDSKKAFGAMMHRPPRVAVLIETSREVGRGMLRGVARYVRRHGPWSLYYRPLGLGDAPPAWLKHWHGDGILARIENSRMARAVIGSGLPAIDLRGQHLELGLPHVGAANDSVVRLALDHLIDVGLRRFAFFGIPRGLNRFQDLRCELFQQYVEESGRECHAFRLGAKAWNALAWDGQQQRIARWLTGLPKPIGLMCGFDDSALQVLDAARRAGIAIPADVALVSVDNDEYICRLADPPLTSVDINPEEIGYQSAALLERMMAGHAPPAGPIEIEPRGIVVRQSSDILAIEDRRIADAVRYIREHACEGVNVHDVLRHCRLSRSTLERGLRTFLGHTPKCEILHVQLERAKNLLRRTELPVAQIAAKTGFRSFTYFSSAFRRKVGVSPSAYRIGASRND